MISFKVESFAEVKDEIQPLWVRHHQEIGEDKDRIPLDPDVAGYEALEQAGKLFIVTARHGSELVGYVFAIVSPHLHYRTSLFAAFDLYWLAPACRGGRTAVRMFRFVQVALKERGVVKIVGNTKLAHDHGRLFEFLGWREAERIYVKVL